MIQFKGYKKKYYGKLIVQSDDLALPEGLLILHGPNGSGKTTLFRCISGIIPYEGSIFLFDVDQKKNPALYRSYVSFSDAKPEFPRYLSGIDIARFFCAARSVPFQGTFKIQRDLGIDEFLDDKIETYSEGMHKKLSLFLAFIGLPRLIILDEPFAFLDANAREKLISIIDRLRNERKINFMISNHISETLGELSNSKDYKLENHKIVPVS